MNAIKPPRETFQVKACRHFGVPLERYGETVLRLTIYPHARWLAITGPHKLLAADRDFVTAVGRLTRWSEFSSAEQDFQHDTRNRRFWRRSLRMRVSVGRMRVLFSEVWGQSTPRSEPRADRADASHGPL